ncbi:chromosome segregation SMC family protein [Patescibacteria group bacterium]
MYLQKLEVQGFKTFAKKTSLSFLPPKAGSNPITSVVGPNGSGKSNLADAIRWVLGEQSLKLLRGKKSEDVIFSGSEGKTRSGFAEVSITLNNEDKTMPIEFSEVTITRRLYRDGQSDYLLNDRSTRLSDIHLLLAQANVGQKSYSVIGQGMVDHILVSTPEERKAFFDDATGVKQFQIKRHESMLKLKRTYENLSEVEMLLREIEPRLRSLKRQVSRLEKREQVETQLRAMEAAYYGTLWWQNADQLQVSQKKFNDLDLRYQKQKEERKEMEDKFSRIASEESQNESEDQGLVALQRQYHEKQRALSKVREDYFQTEKQIELSKVRAQSNWAPLPLNKIIDELETIEKEQRSILEQVKQVKDLKELTNLQGLIDSTLSKSSTLVKRLQRPQPEDIKPDPELVKKLKTLTTDKETVNNALKDLENEMANYAKKEKKVRTELLDLQKELTEKQKQIHLVEKERNEISIESARLEERQQNLLREMTEQLKEGSTAVREARPKEFAETNSIYPEIQRLRYKLELIGGIDPEIIAEHAETKERFEFLDGQVKDLQKAIEDTEKIIDELDEQIRKQSAKAFKQINTEFQKYFKILFSGGTCSLVKLKRDEIEKEEIPPLSKGGLGGVAVDRVSEDTAEQERKHHEEDTEIEAIKKRIKEREDRIVGIDIQATPPGKKLKALNLLSGGERAMTSIALISAIMAVNPGPFVVLDEVDAALDESNTRRFAQILEDLQKLTQFVIITHNRATMEKADLLYGVTMGDDGISNLLSVNLEEVEQTETARR